jgi:AcrR family transcriptional regulator
VHDDESAPSRREEYAQATRRAVVAAARELFGEQGYAGTTVQQIARRARVAPATVYAQCGGKQGLLETLMDTWTAGALVQEIIAACAAAPTGVEKLDVLADGYVTIYATSGDIVRIVTDAAASVAEAKTFLKTANDRHHQALVQIAAQLRDTGDLAGGLSDDDVADIIFFHFRYEQFTLAAYEFGWGESRARDWIRERVRTAILRRRSRTK